MKLKAYDVIITLRDPDDIETELSITMERVPREKLLTVKVPLKGTLEQFEEAVEE